MPNNLEIKYLSLNELTPYAKNSRTHSEDQINQVAESIKEFGFTNPILIDEQSNIIAGHGRLEAAKKLGMKEVPTIVLEGLTENERKAYVIADNKLALNSGWNEKALMRELFSLEEASFDLSLTGFNPDELKKLLDIGETNNYIVLYFSNDIDWLSAQNHFDIKSVHSKRANGKPWSKGIGRVIEGGSYLTKLKGEV